MSITSTERELDENALVITSTGGKGYSDNYKTAAFMLWYKIGKPGSRKLKENLQPEELTGNVPSQPILDVWIREFKTQAVFLDSQVAKELEERMVAEKVEMLDRHAKAGVKMQLIAETYLDEHKDELKVPTALKLWIEGVRIERESRGIPQALDKMMRLSDDDLVRKVTELLNDAPVEFEQIEDENENSNIS